MSSIWGKALLMENSPGLCYKLSTPVPPGSASSGQSHLSDLQPSHNGNKPPMFCMVALHLRWTLHAPPVPLLFVLAKVPPQRCPWAGEEHSTPWMPLSGIPLCHTHAVRTKPTLDVGRSWSCWKKANIPLLLKLKKCPSTGSTQLS